MKRTAKVQASPPLSGDEGVRAPAYGEMARLIESFDWARSPLGPMAQWPQSLKTALNICLNSRFQLAIYWGPELAFIYNDAEREVIGAMHPFALGKPAREVLVDMWDTVGPMLHQVLERGEATWSVDQPLMIDRYGLLEEAFFTWSYSPIPDDKGGIGGVLLVTEDTTHRVLAERRLRTLIEMAAESSVALGADEASAMAMSILSQNPMDIPFALMYLIDATGSVRLCARTDSCAGRPSESFPLEGVTQQREVQQIGNLARFFDSEHASQLPKSALILPIFEGGLERIAGFLVAGVSDHRKLDAGYRNFFDLIAAQIGTILGAANARKLETDLRVAQEELLRQSTNVIHDLAGKLIIAQEEERKRIARELHDDISQRMAMLEISLQQFERGTAELSSKARQQLHHISEAANEVSKEIHDMSHQLHPSKLDMLGLVACVGGLCREFSEQHNLQVQFDHHGIPRNIPKDVTLCLFRIVQEALRNVAKHSGTAEAKVELCGQCDRIDLCISDSGAGFDAKSALGEGGLGLISMRERLRLVGGRLAVESEPSHGTRIRACIPLSGASAGVAGDGKVHGASA